MQPPKMYSLESYEPTVLRPEEIKQDNNYIRRAFTEKKVNNFKFNLQNIPILNPQFTNNVKLMNNNIYNVPNMPNSNNLPNTFTVNIPTSISMNNPFANRNVKKPNLNKVFTSIQFNNPFTNNKTNDMKIIHPMTSKNIINFQKNNIPRLHILPLPLPRNIHRSKSSSQYLPIYPHFNTLQTSGIPRTNNMIPVYGGNIYFYKNKYI